MLAVMGLKEIEYKGKMNSRILKTEWSLRSVVKLNNKGIRAPRQEGHTEIQDVLFASFIPRATDES